jgi:3-oxoacyl-[acyl-carrier-protein] synthase-3
MLERLTRKLGLPPEKVPIALDGFGNTSSASVPVTLCQTVGRVPTALNRVVLGGFGVGFSWGAAAVGLGKGVVMPLLEVSQVEAA